MTTLHHAIKIAAPRSKVYTALTNPAEFAKWHFAPIEGQIAVGEVFSMNAKPHLSFSWKTLELVEDTRIVQEGIDSPGDAGKRITFDLSDADGGTLVSFTDGEWKDGDPNMAYCNTHWGAALTKLKGFVEEDL